MWVDGLWPFNLRFWKGTAGQPPQCQPRGDSRDFRILAAEWLDLHGPIVVVATADIRGRMSFFPPGTSQTVWSSEETLVLLTSDANFLLET